MLHLLNGITDYHLPTNHIDKQQTVCIINYNGITYLTLLCPVPLSSCKERVNMVDILQMCKAVTQ
jgi:hypothetical protein